MESKKRLRVTEATLRASLERELSGLQSVLETLKQELIAKNAQIASLQGQLQMVLDDKFFRPEISTQAAPNANKLHDAGEEIGDQPQFEQEGDAAEMTAGDGDIDGKLTQIAQEAGFPTEWAREHRA